MCEQYKDIKPYWWTYGEFIILNKVTGVWVQQEAEMLTAIRVCQELNAHEVRYRRPQVYIVAKKTVKEIQELNTAIADVFKNKISGGAPSAESLTVLQEAGCDVEVEEA